MNALVIGGTGPTGHFIVNGLRARGYRVAILHTGNHEIDEIPDDVEHIHTDPFDLDAFTAALGTRRFDICVATYGRLRRIAEAMEGRCGRFLSVGGVPVYRGYMNPEVFSPAGLPVPTAEDAGLVELPEDDEKGFRIARTEQAVLEHHPTAAHFRYPYVYGPYQLVPREWCVVRRILDGRKQIILPEDGLTLQHYGYVENLAHALLLAVDQPEASSGQIYNCADEEVLTLRQFTEIVADCMDATLEVVSMPYQWAVSARPLMLQPLPTHRVLDIAKLKSDLGYRDVVSPREGLRRSVEWLVANPPERGGREETVLQDPFDYAAEDALIEQWQRLLGELKPVQFVREPGYTMSYSGPGGKKRSTPDFD